MAIEDKEIILLKVSGQDKPGVTAGLTSILATYDAVILDLGLPEVDGLTVLDRWRKEGRATPVLVLTARDSWSDKVAGLDAGADDYLANADFLTIGAFNAEVLRI